MVLASNTQQSLLPLQKFLIPYILDGTKHDVLEICLHGEAELVNENLFEGGDVVLFVE